LNIGIVTTWFERGAAYVSRQYSELLSQEFHVYIYARGENFEKNNSHWNSEGITWGKESKIPVPHAIDKRDFRRWIDANSIDTVFFNEQQWLMPVLWCNEWGIKTGAYIDYYTEETVDLFAVFDFLVCNTRRHYSVFDWHPECFYVPWGTDINLFKPRSFDIVDPGFVTFFQSCGYSPVRKGTDFVLEAFDKLEGNAKLVIHSQADLLKCLPEHIEIMERLIGKEKLKLVNKTVTAPGLYHLGDVYVAPSRLEGIGLTVAEALSCGLPLITVDFPPMNEFVEDGAGFSAKVDRIWARKDGYYWPQCKVDMENFVRIMESFIQMKAPEIIRSKKAARAFVEKALNWKDRKEKVLDIFANSKKRYIPKCISEKITEYHRRNYGLNVKLAEKFPTLYSLAKRFI